MPLQMLPRLTPTLIPELRCAILDDSPLIAPGEGLYSVELANGILYSSLIGQTLELPMDGAAFGRSSSS